MSSPEPRPTPEEARKAARVALLINLRRWHPDASEPPEGLMHEIAALARTRDFASSGEEACARLEALGFPRWFVRGLQGEERTTAEEERAAPEEEVPRKGGEPTKLPPAARADYLFGILSAQMENDRNFARECEEVLRGGRFETWWRTPEGTLAAVGAAHEPVSPLRRLIAMYALTEAPLDLLVDALHHDAKNADLGEIEAQREKLKLAASRVARVVRGGAVDQGKNPRTISSDEQAVAPFVNNQRRRGIPHEEIARWARELFDLDLSAKDVRRIEKWGLERPDERLG